MPDKRTEILESAKDNNGERTVLKSVLAPYATVFSHFHTLFTETFYVEEGEIDIWNGFGKIHLEKGQAASIERNTPHHYLVGKKEATVVITLEPGSLSFEQAIHIMQGMHRDGSYAQLCTMEKDKLAFLSIIAELTDSHTTGQTKEQIEMLLHSTTNATTEALKQEWFRKYCH